MSASNWAACPRCLARMKADHESRVADVRALYGKVPIEEFEAERDAIEAINVEDEILHTFREDYEFSGAEEGEIHASYSGRCEDCDLSVELRESKRFWDGEKIGV